jgi:hypothetical protein
MPIGSDDMKKLDLVSAEEAEATDYLVCIPWVGEHYFDDDVKASCVSCGIEVRHRPHAPKKPARICMMCAIELSKPLS